MEERRSTEQPTRAFRLRTIALLVTLLLGLATISSSASAGAFRFEGKVRAPTNSSRPQIVGTASEGQGLTASSGTWTGSPSSFAYAWQRCNASGQGCLNIGVTNSVYVLTAKDVASTVRVVVTATNSGGSKSAASATTAPVTAPPPPPPSPPVNTSPPDISGSLTQGQAVTASAGTWSGSPSTYSFRWLSCDTSGNCAGIAGATSAVYVLTAAEVGRTLRVVVTAANPAGTATASSAATTVVSALSPPSSLPDCTIYVAPGGNSTNDGASPASPVTIAAANVKSVPGSVICLAAGVYRSGFVQLHSGAPNSWIVWRSYNGTPVLDWDTNQSPNLMFKLSDGAGYVEFNGLSFDGASIATAAVGCYNHSHHIRVLNSHVQFMGAAGISIMNCDYATIAHNAIYRFGDAEGWSSGISLNWDTGAFWFDQAPGFHDVVADNVIAGGVDNSGNHSDGNGIILDLGGNIAPTLLANNVVYMNGGRGIATLQTTGKVVVLNNTLYKNGLDLRMSGIGEAVPNASSNQIWANNIVYSWEPRYTYQLLGGSTNISYAFNAQYGGQGTQYIASSIVNDPVQIGSFDPEFVNPPFVDPIADGQWRSPPTPDALGQGLALRSGSSLVGAGVDPRTLPGLDSALIAGIETWAMTAVDGTSRPAGSGFDYGAYER